MVKTMMFRRSGRLRFRDQIRAELCPSLVDADGMTNDFRPTSCSIGKLTTLHPRILEPWDTVDYRA